jgi:hypothetical protein
MIYSVVLRIYIIKYLDYDLLSIGIVFLTLIFIIAIRYFSCHFCLRMDKLKISQFRLGVTA